MRRVLGVALTVALVLPAFPAWAQEEEEPTIEIEEEPPPPEPEVEQPPPEPPPEPEMTPAERKKRERARSKLVKEGDKLFKKGDAEKALAKYKEAYEQLPTPLLYYPMAKAEEKLGRTMEAIAHYEQFIAEAPPEVPEELKVDAQVSITELEKTIVVITFEVEPEGATIMLDDVELGQAPLGKPVRVQPGDHSYSLTLEGYEPVNATVGTQAGDRPTLTYSLKKKVVVQVQEDEEPEPTPPPPKKSNKKKVILWSGVGLTGALTLGWVITGTMALSKHGTFDDPSNPRSERESAQSSGKTLALTSDIMLVGALASGGFTAWYYFKVYKKKEAAGGGREQGAPPVPGGDDDDIPPGLSSSVVVPWVSAEGGGLSWMGAF